MATSSPNTLMQVGGHGGRESDFGDEQDGGAPRFEHRRAWPAR